MNRSYHFIPAHKIEYMENIGRLDADAVILDMEDSVPAESKANARENIYRIYSLAKSKSMFIRINGYSSPEFSEDMKLLEKIKAFNIMIPKFEATAEDIALCSDLRKMNKDIKLIILIESLKGLENLGSLLKCGDFFGVALGLEDLFSELIIIKEEATALVRHIKLKTILKAKAYGTICLDSISLEFKDMDIFRNLCIESVNLGFDGMMSIHPAQVPVINECFSPAEADIQWADKVLRLSKGVDKGYLKKDGVIITPPKIRKAKTILNYGRSQ